jgi:hypothetical protein
MDTVRRSAVGIMQIVCTWAQDERCADLHMAQPNVSVSNKGQFPPAGLVRGGLCGR